MKLFAKRDRNYGPITLGFCTTIIRLRTTALVLREFFAKNSTHVAPQPPYSPDLAPCDFWLFPKLKRPLRGNRFESIEEIQRESARALKAIHTEDFSACFEDWKKRWQKCIWAGGGDYFEGDDTDLEE